MHRRVAVFSGLLLAVLVFSLVTPLATAEAAGWSARASEPAAVDSLAAGDTAIVRADGRCLNLRATPGLDGERIECMPDGATVSVLAGVVEADGYRWLEIQWSAHTGWAADQFLAPYTPPPGAGSSCGSQSVRPGFNGGLHTGGGLSLVTWGGGTMAGMENRTVSEGCTLRSAWATNSQGRFVGYLAGAPDFVNEAWRQHFPGGYVPSGQLLLVNCSPHNGNIAAISASTLVPPPGAAAPQRVGGPSAPAISAKAAVVIDGDSGAVLFEKDAYRPLPPASLTKIVTAILAIEGTDLDAWVLSGVDASRMPGSSVMGLRPSDCFTMRDLLYGLMLPSGNDAALAIGRFMGLADDAFVHQMNTLATRLGLGNSSFNNPHGLDGPQHLMSAYDIAVVSRYGMTLPEFRNVVGARSWTAVGARELTVYNVNSFLGLYSGSDGVKTGFTSRAGRTLSASAARDGKRLYVVVLDAQDRHQDAVKLLDWAFDNHRW